MSISCQFFLSPDRKFNIKFDVKKTNDPKFDIKFVINFFFWHQIFGRWKTDIIYFVMQPITGIWNEIKNDEIKMKWNMNKRLSATLVQTLVQTARPQERGRHLTQNRTNITHICIFLACKKKVWFHPLTHQLLLSRIQQKSHK